MTDRERERQRIVKCVPRPGWLSMCSAPPSFLISTATTSMPTPRPACCVTGPGGGEARLEHQLHHVLVREL
jgi:hypothetical protein